MDHDSNRTILESVHKRRYFDGKLAMAVASSKKTELWRERLLLPNYRVTEAARYARVSTQTVAAWHKEGGRRALSPREKWASLSYLQLIEVAVVAAFRKAGLQLKAIRETREYVGKELESNYPFAEYQFKTDGRRLFMDYEQIVGDQGRGKLLRPDAGGQLAWDEIIGRLLEFEYERGDGIAIRWHVTGPNSSIVIDPQVAFGAPAVNGTPTWILKGRWEAGERLDEISDDFELDVESIKQALIFEGIELNSMQAGTWTH